MFFTSKNLYLYCLQDSLISSLF